MDELVTVLLDAPLFHDRAEGGRVVARLLPALGEGALVVGLARGGVEVAAAIATEHGWPLDALAVRKVRHPGQPEYALGAVTPEGGGVYLRARNGLTESDLADAVAAACREAQMLDRRLHADHEASDRAGRPVLLVDDGLATGATMVAAARWARSGGAAPVVAAVPVAARQSVEHLLEEVDALYCPHVRDDLYAVGVWYADFSQLSDQDVLRLLRRGRAARRPHFLSPGLSRGRR